MRARWKALLLVVLPLALLVALLEGFGFWMLRGARRAPTFEEAFYVYDRELIVRLRPGLRGDFRSVRPELTAAVATNSAGFRGDEFPPPDPRALRVLVLGDSVSFGFGVGDDETWPAVLHGALRALAGGRPVQLRNLAIPGYSTAQGRILFERHALHGDYHPDLVLFAFGFNDGFLYPQDDTSTREGERARHETSRGRVRQWLAEHSWFFGWLWRTGELAALTPRVAPDELRGNLHAVAGAARAAAIELVLIDASLPHCYAREAVREVAAAHGCAALSLRDAFTRHRALPPEGPWPNGGALRVAAATHGQAIPAAPDGGPAFYAVLLPRADRRPASRRVPLNDLGRDGDAVAGDGEWSCLVDLEPGAIPELGFVIPGFIAQLPSMRSDGVLLNSVHLAQPGPPTGGPGEPAVLAVPLPNACPWPDLVLSPDPIHASPEGCRVIAEAVQRAVLVSAAWRAFTR